MSRRYRTQPGGGGWLAALLVVAAVAGMLPDRAPGAAAAPASPPASAVPAVGGQRSSGPGVDGVAGSFDNYVSALAPQMRVAVRQLDAAMGGGLRITSGYRSAGYQAQLCRRVQGPCAPPGRSMHQHGLAIDTPDWQAGVAAHPKVVSERLGTPP